MRTLANANQALITLCVLFGLLASSICVAGPALQTGLNGTWWNPEQDGQGFVIHIIPEANQVFVAWFTFAPAGGKQLWLTGTGSLDESPVRLELSSTQGGALGSAEPAPSSELWGNATLDFSSCTQGTFSFEGKASGQIAIQRLTPVVSCSEASAK